MSYTSLTTYSPSDSLSCGIDYSSSCDILLFDEDSGGTYQNVSCHGCYFEAVESATNNIMECDDSYSNCLINCPGSQSCLDRKMYCRPTNYVIGQTSGHECQNCVINCGHDDACIDFEVYSFDCANVLIYALGELSMKKGNIVAPYNGNLFVYAGNALESSYDTSGNNSVIFAQGNTFIANETNYFEFECEGSFACIRNTIYAEFGYYFEMNCFSGANCSFNNIYCPDNRLNDGVSCNIYYDDSQAAFNNYFAVEGFPTV